MFFRKRKNEMDYTLVFNSMRLMVFFKNEKTLSFLEENKNLLSMNKEINQETNLFFTIPFRFDKSEFKPFINNEPLVYGVDYIEYSTNDKMVSPKIKNEELLDNKSIFRDIMFTCLIDENLAPSIYKAFRDVDPRVINQKLFDYLCLKIADIKHDQMWNGIIVKYLKTVLEICENDISLNREKKLNYKDVLVLFSDFNEIKKYKKETRNYSNILLLEDFFNNTFKNISLFEDEELNPDFKITFDYINNTFIEFIEVPEETI